MTCGIQCYRPLFPEPCYRRQDVDCITEFCPDAAQVWTDAIELRSFLTELCRVDLIHFSSLDNFRNPFT